MSSASERALCGALLQDPEAVFPLADSAGIVAESFTDGDCIRVWRAAAILRHKSRPVEMVAIAEAMEGDAGDNMAVLAELVESCPTTAYASRYADQVAEGQRRRRLQEAATMAAEALAKGGAVDVVAGQLKAAGEAVEASGTGPQIVTARDFMTKPIPEPPQVIRRVLRAGQVGMVASTSKGGKTWLVQSLGLAVPNGLNWLKWQTTPGRVLYVDPELPPYDGQTRLASLAEAMGLDRIPEGLDLWRVKGESITVRGMIPRILQRQKQVGEPYALILLDSLYCLNGGRDENDNTAQAQTMQELYALTAQTGAAVLVTHHFSKGNKANTDHLDRASGAGVFTRAPDVFMTLTPHREPDCYSVETTCRSFARPDPFVIRWAFPMWSLADELDPEHLKRHGAGRRAQFTPEQILDLLPPDGLPHHEWEAKAMAELGCGKTTFNKLLGKAKADGQAVLGFGRYVPGASTAAGPDVLSAGLRASLGEE